MIFIFNLLIFSFLNHVLYLHFLFLFFILDLILLALRWNLGSLLLFYLRIKKTLINSLLKVQRIKIIYNLNFFGFKLNQKLIYFQLFFSCYFYFFQVSIFDYIWILADNSSGQVRLYLRSIFICEFHFRIILFKIFIYFSAIFKELIVCELFFIEPKTFSACSQLVLRH